MSLNIAAAGSDYSRRKSLDIIEIREDVEESLPVFSNSVVSLDIEKGNWIDLIYLNCLNHV